MLFKYDIIYFISTYACFQPVRLHTIHFLARFTYESDTVRITFCSLKVANVVAK
jgi:hypothetical protein